MDFTIEEQPENLIIPLELTKIIYSDWNADLTILDKPDQVYGKALHGDGTVTFKNGNKYEGELFNGMLHGKGKFMWQNGVIYTGDFYYNTIEGKGKYEWTDGSVYEGDVKASLRDGYGTFISPGGEAVYSGEWKDGLRHGKGKIQFKSGALYEGEFAYGCKQGFGKMVYPSGNYYEGEWLKDKKSNYGVMHWLNTNEKYYGQWKENYQNGHGVHIWLENKGEGKLLRNRYEGNWTNGQRHGKGVFYYANGSKYEGEWKNNLKEGFAIFIEDNGNVIQGQFKADRLIKEEKKIDVISSQRDLKETVLPSPKEPKQIVIDSPGKKPQQNANEKKKDPQQEKKDEKEAKHKEGEQKEKEGEKEKQIPAATKTEKQRDISKEKEQKKKKEETKEKQKPKDAKDAKEAEKAKESSKDAQKETPQAQQEQQKKEIPLDSIKEKETEKTQPKDKEEDKNEKDKVKDKDRDKSKDKDKQKQKQQSQNSTQQQLTNQVAHNQTDSQAIATTSQLPNTKKKEIEINPFTYLIDISDLTQNIEDDILKIHRETQNMLLRHNSSIKQWYKYYSQRQNSLGEDAFAMDMLTYWRFLKDIKALNHDVTLAQINRLFYQGPKNQYDLTTSEIELDKKVNILKKIGRGLNLQEIKDINILNLLTQLPNDQKLDWNNPNIDKQFDSQKLTDNIIDIHSGSRVVLFRHFVELLVRTSLIKYSNLKELHRCIEKLIESRIKPYFENKLQQKQIGQPEDDILFDKYSGFAKQNEKVLSDIFNKVSIVNRSDRFGVVDKTIKFKNVIKLLEDSTDKNLIISLFERYFDPENTVAHAEQAQKEEHSSINRKEHKSKNQKNNAKKASVQVDLEKIKMSKILQILETELIQQEFYDILLSYLFKKEKDLQTNKEQEIEKRLKDHLEKIASSQGETKKKMHGMRIWPASEKDSMKLELAQLRIKQKEEAEERKRKEEEKKREARERAKMQLEDINIPSDPEENSDDDY